MSQCVQFSSSNGSTPQTASFGTPVALGQLIIVCCGASAGGLFTVTDNLGNVYTMGARTEATPNVAMFYSVVTHAGSCTVTVSTTGQPLRMIIGQYSGDRFYTQGACTLNIFPPTIPIPGPCGDQHACRTIQMPLADSLIVTAACANGAFYTTQSDTGDTRVTYDGPDPNPITCSTSVALSMWDRLAVGPGTANAEIESITDGTSVSAISMVFSKPLARPGGLTSQFGFQPGIGFSGGSEEAPSDGSVMTDAIGAGSQRNIRCNLPYVAQIGNLLLVALYQNNFTATFAVTDDYGNNYTQIVDDPSQGSDASIFYTIITHLPTPGQVFVVKVAITCGTGFPGFIYQAPGIAIAEYTGSFGVPSGAVFLSQTPSGGSVQLTTHPLTVAKNSLLFAIAGVDSFNSNSVVWSPLAGYTIRSEWDFAQEPAAITNRFRLAMFAVMDKFAPSAGTFDAEVLVSRNGALGMVLVSFPTVPTLTLACPSSAAALGVSYSSSFVAGGGTPPYTFAIISGSLPPGLTLNTSTGLVSGIPTTSGFYSYTGQVTDANGRTATASCTIAIGGSVCDSVSPQPSTDVYFELQRVYATMKPAPRIPVRGS